MDVVNFKGNWIISFDGDRIFPPKPMRVPLLRNGRDHLSNIVLITHITLSRINSRKFCNSTVYFYFYLFSMFYYHKICFFNHPSFSASFAQKTRMWEFFLRNNFVCQGCVTNLERVCLRLNITITIELSWFFDSFNSCGKFVTQTLKFSYVFPAFLTGFSNWFFYSSVILSISSIRALQKQDFKNIIEDFYGLVAMTFAESSQSGWLTKHDWFENPLFLTCL